MIKFNGQIWKTGNSYVLTIPYDFVKHGQIKEDQEYSIELTEVCDDERNNHNKSK